MWVNFVRIIYAFFTLWRTFIIVIIGAMCNIMSYGSFFTWERFLYSITRSTLFAINGSLSLQFARHEIRPYIRVWYWITSNSAFKYLTLWANKYLSYWRHWVVHDRASKRDRAVQFIRIFPSTRRLSSNWTISNPVSFFFSLILGIYLFTCVGISRPRSRATYGY